MIDALVSGHIHGQPTRRIGKSGQPFVTAKVRAGVRTGETAWINCVAFRDSVMVGLLALGDGAAVAVSGELTAAVYTARTVSRRSA